jgi:hypothetical protein
VRICIDGSKDCFDLSDERYAQLFQAQNGRQGINLPKGQFPRGNITCGGEICGTARYFERGLEDQTVNLVMLIEGVRSVAALGRAAYQGIVKLFARDAVEETTVVLGKTADLEAPGALRPGEKTLDLPNLGNPKANWAQNSSKLRQAMSEGQPIRDVSTEPMVNGAPGKNTGFLRAERNLLENHGWKIRDGYWYPPK